MAIAPQSAMPPIAARPRRPYALHVPAPSRPGLTLSKIAALVVCTALGAAFAAGFVGLALVMLVAGVGH